MVTKIEQYVLWHPERKVLMPFTNHDENLDMWATMPEAAAYDSKMVAESYESQGWKIVKATVKIEEI